MLNYPAISIIQSPYRYSIACSYQQHILAQPNIQPRLALGTIEPKLEVLLSRGALSKDWSHRQGLYVDPTLSLNNRIAALKRAPR
jgi:hypothetical protein